MMYTHAVLKMTKYEKQHVSKISFPTDFIDPQSCKHFQWKVRSLLQVCTVH